VDVDNYDIKKAYPALYAPTLRDFHVVDVPELLFLQVDGHGDPNTAAAYTEAVEALYSLSYAIRAVAKAHLGRVHTVGPLEGLWSADDPAAFRDRDKSAWDWTMMISQPEWITPAIMAEAVERTSSKDLPGLHRVRFEPYVEGQSVQVLHVGSYDDETPTLARLHDEYLPAHGLTFNGWHHEIYLSDPRRTEPAKLRTVLRQPVAPAHHDGDLASRLRATLGPNRAIREVRMFGGLCFMVDDKMAVCAMKGGDLLARTDPQRSAELLALDGARQAEMGHGRSMGKSWITVAADAVAAEEGLRFWVDAALAHNRG
ncbi:GyrI-like domain-containing protein, partial [Tessaracoccus sp.]